MKPLFLNLTESAASRKAGLAGLVFLLLLVSCPVPSFGAETNAALRPTAKVEDTNAQEMLRSYLQLQEQIHATQLAIEQTRKEAGEAAEATAKTLAARLQGVEQALAAQRARELETVQSSNRVMLAVAGTFAVVGVIALLLMAYFQWRTVNRLAEISVALPPLRLLEPGKAVAALGPGATGLSTLTPADRSNLGLLSALEQLEKRIHELEQTTHPSLKDRTETPGDRKPGPGSNGSSSSNGHLAAPAEPNAARLRALLQEGQSLLDHGQAEAALACFDEVLKLDAAHPEALVKKGAALEQAQKFSEAIEYYDRAIAADGTMTIAYLHKGGLFNRMERFGEALQCYEWALRTQEKRAS